MASSYSRLNNNDQVVDEEEEYEEEVEYEEIEEEVEEEVEIEEEEEIEEEVEEEPEEEEEEEPEEESEDVEEKVKVYGEEEKVDDVEEKGEIVEEEEEYEEVEEEEYEEVEIEVEEEVTDEEDAVKVEVEGNANVVLKSNDFALVATKSNSPVPMVAYNEDGSPDVKFRDEVCLRSGNTTAVKSERSIVTSSHASKTFCLGGGTSSHELHDGDGKSRDEVCLRTEHASAMKSEASILTGVLASETFVPDGGSSSRELHNGDGAEISSLVGRSISPKFLGHIPGPSNDGSDSVKDNQGHVDRIVLVSASEKHVSAPDNLTTDAEECKHISKEADLHSSPRRDKEKKESRAWVPQVRPRSLSPGVECEDSNKRPAIPCEYFARGWCIKGSSCRFLHKSDHANATRVDGDIVPTISERQHDKGSGEDVNALELLAYKSNSTAKDIHEKHGEDLKLRRYEDKDTTPLLERKISSSLVSVDSPKSSYNDGARSISTPRELETDTFKEHHSSDTHGLPFAEGGSMLRQNFFSRRGSSLRELGVSPGSDSILRLVEESTAMRRRYSLDIKNSVPYHISSYQGTSLCHNSPLFSRSDSNKFSDASYAHDLRTYINYKMTFTPYNWEPSVPFRSSFISAVNKPADVQYDPFRDSIEEPDAGHASLKQSSYGQTQNVQSLSGQNPLEFQKRIQIDNWDKSYSGNDKANPALESESAATSASDAQNRNITEENPMVPGSVKAILKASRGINDGNSNLHSGLKVEKGRQPNELDDEESKAIRVFRAALIEFVKDLMKPIWHEGRLSKDVYKVIVQKAEDKILSTLQPSQVPKTSESVKQYLSSSCPKILKLIQAYVDKYGKF